MKVKIFYGDPYDVEKVMNEWLSENKDLYVDQITQSTASVGNRHLVIITVLYSPMDKSPF